MSEEKALELDVAAREGRRVLYSKGLGPEAAVAPVVRLSGPIPPFIENSDRDFPVHHRSHLLGYGRRHFG